jgi:ribosomal protein L37AE/L43A
VQAKARRARRGGALAVRALREGKAVTITAKAERKCKVCRHPFVRRSMTHIACSPECAKFVAEAKRAKAERADLRARKDAAKPRGQWIKEAQTAFNAWVRARDAALPCVSCGRHHDGQYHAGHFLSTGARPELRFDPANVHKQCSACNTHLSGNLVLYRAELMRRIGPDEVARLEGPQAPRKYSADELRALRDEFREKARALAP